MTTLESEILHRMQTFIRRNLGLSAYAERGLVWVRRFDQETKHRLFFSTYIKNGDLPSAEIEYDLNCQGTAEFGYLITLSRDALS